MRIAIQWAQGKVPVTVLQLTGDLDASSYKDLIAQGQSLYKAGVRDILVDMSGVPYMSSSGLVALHTLALLLQGQARGEEESGWEEMRSIRRDLEHGMQKHLKLLSPGRKVDSVLEMAGFKRILEIHTDLDTAIASFS
jgi:anti-anti-sigma factor